MFVEVIGFFIFIYNRFIEMKNGHLGSANKELEFSVALLERIQCIHIVNLLFLDKQAFQTSR
jgi:hypothetical protein